MEKLNNLEIVENKVNKMEGFLDDATLKKWRILGPEETLKDAFNRVAKSLSVFENNYEGGDSADFEERVLEQLLSKKIIPSTSIVMNAGRIENTPLSACAVPPVELRDDWSKVKTKVDELHYQGMGTGFNFDETDNPIAMIRYLNKVGIEGQKNEQQLRPVGNMGIMSLGNPNIVNFINLKNGAEKDHEDWVFNLSVSLSEDNIEKIINKEDIILNDGRIIHSDVILDNIASSIWLSGDPGLLFIDRVRKDNTVPSAGEAVSMAPCGEIGLARGETCQFSYINLEKFIKDGEIDYDGLEETINISINLLDNVIDYNVLNGINDESAKIAKQKRKIGLGVCGFNDALKKLSVKYGSKESVTIARNLFSFINYISKKSSINLATKRGSFGMFNESQLSQGDSYLMKRLSTQETETVSANQWKELIEEIKENGIRNCSTIALPPTGRSSQIIGASQSIEPSFDEFLNISSVEQLEIVSEIQKFVDESISKTINVGEKTSIEEIKEMLILSMRKGLKGITIYRNGSRSNQPKKY